MIEAFLQEISSPAALIGRTPLVRLRRLEPRPGVEIYAKLESQNPGGSVKDRAALAMIVEGERTGALRRGRVLLDATSGNTGISYAMLGAARGYRVTLCVPANVTAERKRLLHAYGAELILTDPMEGSDGAIREARRRYARDPDRYFYPDQYSNPANWRAH
jgi:cysteine synthase B